MILPWHQNDWDSLISNRDRLHHGALIKAAPGTGLREYALQLSQYLLCESPDLTTHVFCKTCQNCRLFEAGTHPDFHVVTSEYESVNSRLPLLTSYSERFQDARERDKKARPGRVISVDQVRKLISRFSTHTHISKTRVALVLPADRMNINAANALLKLLEEPPSESVLILATSEPSRLPKTILSRCVVFNLSTPEYDDSIDWLKNYIPQAECDSALNMSSNQPLHARTMYQSGELKEKQNYLTAMVQILENKRYPLDFAQKMAKMEFDNMLLWLQNFIVELVIWKSMGRAPFWNASLTMSLSRISINRLYSLYDRICHYRKISRGSVNEQLAMEDLLISLQRTAQIT